MSQLYHPAFCTGHHAPSKDSRCFRSCIFPRKDSVVLMGDRSSSLQFIVLSVVFGGPHPASIRSWALKLLLKGTQEHSAHCARRPLLCSCMTAEAVCQPLLLILPVVFRKKPRCSGYNPRMLNLGLGRHRHWGSSDDAKEQPRLRTIDSFPIHTGKNPRSYHGPQRPYTTNLVTLPSSPAHHTLDMGASWLFLDPWTLFPSHAPALVRILQNVLSLTPCRSLLRCHHFREALLGYSF